MNIREVTLADAEELARVHVESWQTAYRELLPEPSASGPSLERRIEGWRMEQPGCKRLIVEDADGINGFIVVGPSRDTDTDPKVIAELYAVYVAPSSWGKGMATALWKVAKEWLKSERYAEVVLTAYEDNTRARHYYEAMGFRLDPTKRIVHCISERQIAVIRYRMTI